MADNSPKIFNITVGAICPGNIPETNKMYFSAIQMSALTIPTLIVIFIDLAIH